jgi:hypothetical protein
MSKNQTLTSSFIGRFLPFVYIGHEPVCMCPFLCFFSGLKNKVEVNLFEDLHSFKVAEASDLISWLDSY